MSEFDPRYGEAVGLGNAIVRLVANNPGPLTGAGTNTYLLGTDTLMILDPGPDDAAHRAAILSAVAGRPVSHILISHTHHDHIEGLPALRAETGGLTVGEGPYRASRALNEGETNPFAKSSDTDFVPDIAMADGDRLDNGEVAVGAIATPGHTANHLAFTLGEDCFSGDHVMGWSSTVVAPPDGSMRDYMTSLERLLGHAHARYLPGHGDLIEEPHKRVSALKSHRLMRERAIKERLQKGDRTVAEIVAALYTDIDVRLVRAAGLSVLAQLEKLADDGAVVAEGYGVDARWHLA
ncbi:MBL fold metallo-hydrolase [Acuticoccus mangrovi]|uniref:MBL fold metallo-hydrolase n=1 Tax=Acuticoccus mangrovi TaxID=2796142 RepID=A0A934MBS6_9HYPH|nr:MBL fold metallo-hydrolase [Acuticoccus mangrovi]MBJ3774462.1 MBL fold metallo-hydrolase [Acuticoccus mangrovi]